MALELDRYWLLTWTTYGTWLPGDDRGFVSSVRVDAGRRKRHNRPQTEYDRSMPGLKQSAESLLKGQPIFLVEDQANSVLAQLLETAGHRGWGLFAVAVMRNHVYLVVGVPSDPDPEVLLRDFKSYASRKLNRAFGEPDAPRWWTEPGSKRKLKGENAVEAAVTYVLNQEHPLVIWSSDDSNPVGLDSDHEI